MSDYINSISTKPHKKKSFNTFISETIDNNNTINSLSQYTIGNKIGEGMFGKVKIGTHNLTKEKVAIKILEKSRIKEKADKIRVEREIKILKQMKHINIVQLYSVIQTTTTIYLVMEHSSGTELFQYIINKRRIPEQEAVYYFQQIISGIDYMHQNKICHRDIKPENMILETNKTIKIIDFGLSNTFGKSEYLSTACGSPCYAAPEMIAGNRYKGSSIDIWSAGIVLYAMICGYLPFEDKNNNELFKKIMEGKYAVPSFVSDSCKDLIKSILNVDYTKRYSINEIISHPWMASEKPYTHKGLLMNTIVIPIDEELIAKMSEMGFTKQDIRMNLLRNKFNNITTTYYLLVKTKTKYNRTSVSDFISKDFISHLNNEKNQLSKYDYDLDNVVECLASSKGKIVLPKTTLTKSKSTDNNENNDDRKDNKSSENTEDNIRNSVMNIINVDRKRSSDIDLFKESTATFKKNSLETNNISKSNSNTHELNVIEGHKFSFRNETSNNKTDEIKFSDSTVNTLANTTNSNNISKKENNINVGITPSNPFGLNIKFNKKDSDSAYTKPNLSQLNEALNKNKIEELIKNSNNKPKNVSNNTIINNNEKKQISKKITNNNSINKFNNKPKGIKNLIKSAHKEIKAKEIEKNSQLKNITTKTGANANDTSYQIKRENSNEKSPSFSPITKSPNISSKQSPSKSKTYNKINSPIKKVDSINRKIKDIEGIIISDKSSEINSNTNKKYFSPMQKLKHIESKKKQFKEKDTQLDMLQEALNKDKHREYLEEREKLNNLSNINISNINNTSNNTFNTYKKKERHNLSYDFNNTLSLNNHENRLSDIKDKIKLMHDNIDLHKNFLIKQQQDVIRKIMEIEIEKKNKNSSCDIENQFSPKLVRGSNFKRRYTQVKEEAAFKNGNASSNNT